MNRLIFILSLSFVVGYLVAAYGQENEWPFIKRVLISSTLGIIIALVSQLF